MKQKQFVLLKRRQEDDQKIREVTNSVQFMKQIAHQVRAHSSNLLLSLQFFFIIIRLQVNAKCLTLMRGVKEREQDRSAQQQMLNDLEEQEATLKLDHKKSIGDDEVCWLWYYCTQKREYLKSRFFLYSTVDEMLTRWKGERLSWRRKSTWEWWRIKKKKINIPS